MMDEHCINLNPESNSNLIPVKHIILTWLHTVLSTWIVKQNLSFTAHPRRPKGR